MINYQSALIAYKLVLMNGEKLEIWFNNIRIQRPKIPNPFKVVKSGSHCIYIYEWCNYFQYVLT